MLGVRRVFQIVIVVVLKLSVVYSRSYSSVSGSPEDDAKKRYRDKLDRIGGAHRIDPYLPVNDKLSANPPSIVSRRV